MVIWSDIRCDGRAVLGCVAVGQAVHEAHLRENLAAAVPEHSAEAGCGKPDCGKTSSAGSCSSCSSGGCSSCGSSAAPDLRPYFAHLREKMAERTSLL